MALSRKDYIFIAKCIRRLVYECAESKNQSTLDLLYDLTLCLADYFNSQNERFSYNKFLNACGFEIAASRFKD